MEIRKAGRPKKINAIKPGQLKKGERRFTFIATEKIVNDIKKGAKEEKLKIKEYLCKVLNDYWERNSPKNENERKLKEHINKRI